MKRLHSACSRDTARDTRAMLGDRIEDAAVAIGATLHGQTVGNVSDVDFLRARIYREEVAGGVGLDP